MPKKVVRKYPVEFRERAVRMVVERRADPLQNYGAIASIAKQLGIHHETLRGWVRQADVDAGRRPGEKSSEKERLAQLEAENRELRRANEILKAAAAFFARELDPRPPS
jgi:transposase